MNQNEFHFSYLRDFLNKSENSKLKMKPISEVDPDYEFIDDPLSHERKSAFHPPNIRKLHAKLTRADLLRAIDEIKPVILEKYPVLNADDFIWLLYQLGINLILGNTYSSFFQMKARVPDKIKRFETKEKVKDPNEVLLRICNELDKIIDTSPLLQHPTCVDLKPTLRQAWGKIHYVFDRINAERNSAKSDVDFAKHAFPIYGLALGSKFMGGVVDCLKEDLESYLNESKIKLDANAHSTLKKYLSQHTSAAKERTKNKRQAKEEKTKKTLK